MLIPADAATVALSSPRAGARPVVVAVQLHYEMQCGWPGPGTVTIRFPAAMVVPDPIRAAGVLVDGKPATRLVSHGHQEVVSLPPRKGILCDVIGPGVLKITFTRAARVGNPKAPGTYALTAQHGAMGFTARFAVR
jgi:hypothetical protein